MVTGRGRESRWFLNSRDIPIRLHQKNNLNTHADLGQRICPHFQDELEIKSLSLFTGLLSITPPQDQSVLLFLEKLIALGMTS